MKCVFTKKVVQANYKEFWYILFLLTTVAKRTMIGLKGLC